MQMRNQGGKASKSQTFVLEVLPEVHEEHQKDPAEEAACEMTVSRHDIVQELILPIVQERRKPKAHMNTPGTHVIMMQSGLLGFHIQINFNYGEKLRVQFMPHHLVKWYDLNDPDEVDKMEAEIRAYFLKEQ